MVSSSSSNNFNDLQTIRSKFEQIQTSITQLKEELETFEPSNQYLHVLSVVTDVAAFAIMVPVEWYFISEGLQGAYILTGTLAATHAAPLIAILGLGLIFIALPQTESLSDIRVLTQRLVEREDIDIPRAMELIEKHQTDCAHAFHVFTDGADKANETRAQIEGHQTYNVYPQLLAYVRGKMQPCEDVTEFDLLAMDEIPEPLYGDVLFSKYVCPITQKPIRHIVFNNEDDHYYEKAALQEQLLRRQSTEPTAMESLCEKPALQTVIDHRLKHIGNKLRRFAQGTLGREHSPVVSSLNTDSAEGVLLREPAHIKSLTQLNWDSWKSRIVIDRRNSYPTAFTIFTVAQGIISAAALTIGVVYSMPAVVVLALGYLCTSLLTKQIHDIAHRVSESFQNLQDVEAFRFSMYKTQRASKNLCEVGGFLETEFTIEEVKDHMHQLQSENLALAVNAMVAARNTHRLPRVFDPDIRFLN
jgi:hypothetical protein